MVGIEPPGKDRLPEGPRRDLVLALHDVYRGAGRPGLRRIANEISRNHDYRDTVSYETAGAILHGEGVPRWSKLECLVRQLVAWHHPHLDADEQVSRFLALWNTASNPAESSQSESDIARSIADQLQQEVEQLREQLAAARRTNEALVRARSTDQRTTDGAFRSFPDLIRDHWSAGRHLCIGLDSDASRIPASLRPDADIAVKMLAFNERIVDATFDLVCAYKLNSAYYEALGSAGIEVLSKTVEYINVRAPRTPVIIDAKRADIGDAGRAYARFLFDEVGADAVTGVRL
jgi:Orotidine 5'-phosphate decarboxylase / HUMPS family